ncbi:hypothetical protein D3C77_807480 [compost metagenome]
MGFAHGLVVGLAQGLDARAEGADAGFQPAFLHGDAKPGGHRATGVPEGIEWLAHGVFLGLRRWL